MLTFTEGEHKNETGKQFQTNSTIDFFFVNRPKEFLVRIQMSFQNNVLNPQCRNIRLATTKNDNNYCHLNTK